MDIWNAVLEAYREGLADPMFWKFAMGGQVVGIIAFVIFATPWTILAWRDPQWARPFRIQQKEIPVRKWLWPTIGSLLTNYAFAFAAIFLVWPLLRHAGIHGGPAPGWLEVAGSLAFFIFLDDFLYYWMHRFLHIGWFYKKIHSVHHRQTRTFALAGNYMHPAEFLMTISLLMLGPVLLQSHYLTVYAWVIFRQLEAADGHAGYDFRWNPLNWFPFYHGPVYHDFHHKRFLGNYAGFLSWADAVFGKYAKGYREYVSPWKK